MQDGHINSLAPVKGIRTSHLMQMIRAEKCIRTSGMPNKIASFEEAYPAGLHTVAELVDPRTQESPLRLELLELRLGYFNLYLFRQPTRITNNSVEQLILNYKLRNTVLNWSYIRIEALSLMATRLSPCFKGTFARFFLSISRMKGSPCSAVLVSASTVNQQP